MQTNTLGPNFLNLVDHALASTFWYLLLSRGDPIKDSVSDPAAQRLVDLKPIDAYQHTFRDSLQGMGTMLAESVELSPYLFDHQLRLATYKQISDIVDRLPIVAFNQAKRVNALFQAESINLENHNGPHQYGVLENASYAVAKYDEVFDRLRQGRKVGCEHLWLKTNLVEILAPLSSVTYQACYAHGCQQTLSSLEAVHSSWLHWVARLKAIAVAAGRRSGSAHNIAQLQQMLTTLATQQTLIAQSSDQAQQWTSSIDLRDIALARSLASER